LRNVNGGEGLARIKDRAFEECTFLQEITIHPSVEVIEKYAFKNCISLHTITIPPNVRIIEVSTFSSCHGLRTVNGGEGLERISSRAFENCVSLPRITIHPSVRDIEDEAFHQCRKLSTVNLRDGLEKIGYRAFANCISLVEVIIPSTVTRIAKNAFIGSPLRNVVFSRIRDFVTTNESIRNWWKDGTHKNSLKTYYFLVRNNIPQRIEELRPMQWQADIHDMLALIPSLSCIFEMIDEKLELYEHLMLAFPLLELGIWRSIIREQRPIFVNGSDGSITNDALRMQCRSHAIHMLNQIVPLVIPFLIVKNVETSDDESSDDGRYLQYRGYAYS